MSMYPCGTSDAGHWQFCGVSQDEEMVSDEDEEMVSDEEYEETDEE